MLTKKRRRRYYITMTLKIKCCLKAFSNVRSEVESKIFREKRNVANE